VLKQEGINKIEIEKLLKEKMDKWINQITKEDDGWTALQLSLTKKEDIFLYLIK